MLAALGSDNRVGGFAEQRTLGRHEPLATSAMSDLCAAQPDLSQAVLHDCSGSSFPLHRLAACTQPVCIEHARLELTPMAHAA
jgi:hypothetical protein